MTQSLSTSTADRPMRSGGAPDGAPRLQLRSPRHRTATDPAARRLGWLEHSALAEVVFWLLAGAAVLAGSLLTSCASGPDLRRVVTLTDADIAELSYEQRLDRGARSFRQSLLNDGQIEPAAFYSDVESDPYTKVISTERLQVLVDALAAQGFFDYARGSAAPGSVSRIQLDLGRARYVWSKQPGIQADELRAYNQALVTFQNVYNAVQSYHTGKTDNTVSERHRENLQRYRLERDLRFRNEDGDLLRPEGGNR